ncbi:MAG: nitrite/sulfite reductase [Megasphaera sp.]|jgi:ferredoxin-nitrite reductase|nr:nitrite/sulfite reductase [Megasphaera sp.]
MQISKETIDALQSKFPEFEEACHSFFKGELPPAKYKGISGRFGSYAEKGGKSAMLRLRFPGGTISRDHMRFLHDVIEKYHITMAHFTTGEALQLHHLDGDTTLSLYKDCFANGIYCYGGGGDNPRNVTASPLRGIDSREYFDITPYAEAASAYALKLIPQLHLPRKYKIGFSSGIDNEGHATFKDLGFVAKPNHTVDVYAGGGFGTNGSRFGILIDSDVDPKDILYYVLAMANIYMKYGDYDHRGTARSRFILTKMGDDTFRQTLRAAVEEARKDNNLQIQPQPVVIDKTAEPDDTVLSDNRIGKQKQTGLYYVEYHPFGGTPDMTLFQTLLQTVAAIDNAEIRLNSDETAYIVNLTADEARKIATLTDSDTAKTPFEHSISCVGAMVCQNGLRDSHGIFVRTIKALRQSGLDTTVLPRCRFSGCPSTCTTQELAPIGLRGAVKRVDGVMKPAYIIYAGGSYAFGKEHMSKQLALITEDSIPTFFIELTKLLVSQGKPFDAWYRGHEQDFIDFAERFE